MCIDEKNWYRCINPQNRGFPNPPYRVSNLKMLKTEDFCSPKSSRMLCCQTWNFQILEEKRLGILNDLVTKGDQELVGLCKWKLVITRIGDSFLEQTCKICPIYITRLTRMNANCIACNTWNGNWYFPMKQVHRTNSKLHSYQYQLIKTSSGFLLKSSYQG